MTLQTSRRRILRTVETAYVARAFVEVSAVELFEEQQPFVYTPYEPDPCAGRTCVPMRSDESAFCVCSFFFFLINGDHRDLHA